MLIYSGFKDHGSPFAGRVLRKARRFQAAPAAPL
jgi:hypothetical protein